MLKSIWKIVNVIRKLFIIEFPKRTALFVSVVLFNNLHTTVQLHPLTVFFKFVVVGGCHDVTYLSHNQSVIGLLQIISEDCRKTSKCKGMKIYRTANHTILTIMLFYETIGSSTCHLQTAIIILLWVWYIKYYKV